MLIYIILIVVDVIVVIGIVAVFMSVKRRRDHRSLRNPAPPRWGWSLASGKQQPADVVKDAEDKEPSTQPVSGQEKTGAPVCSLCGAPMVIRAAQKGKYAGKPYFGCSKYPECENTTPHGSLRDTKIMQSILR